jgi:hypothetical protein
VILGQEDPVQLPIQIIDSTFANSSAYCSGANQNPTQAGYQGILGIGFFSQDCGATCSSQANNGVYYSCSGSQCSGTEMPLTSQVQNPVALLAQDNNGTIIMLPRASPGGQLFAEGYLVLGIGTQSNNRPSGVTPYPADPSTGNFSTEYNHISYESFLDTGSNGLYFPEGPGPDCASLNGKNTGWYCPSTRQTLQAVQVAFGEKASFSIEFQIDNLNHLLNTGNQVFAEIGGSGSGATIFDWGLPFFLGRNVYVGLQNRSSPLGEGPYWAY